MFKLTNISLESSLRMTSHNGTSEVFDYIIDLTKSTSEFSLNKNFADMFFYTLPSGKGLGGNPTDDTTQTLQDIVAHTSATSSSGTASASSEAASYSAWKAVDANPTSSDWRSNALSSSSTTPNIIESHTSNVGVNGTIAASETPTDAWLAVDGSDVTFWESTSDAPTLSYAFTASNLVNGYTILTDAVSYPTDWIVEGSSTGIDGWVELDHQSNADFSTTQEQHFSIASPQNLQYYRISFVGGASTTIKINRFQMDDRVTTSILPVTFTYQLASAAVVKGISLTVHDIANAPGIYSIDVSTNGSTWVNVHDQSSEDTWVADTAKNFSFASNSAQYSYARVRVTSGVTGATFVSLSNFGLTVQTTVSAIDVCYKFKIIPTTWNGTAFIDNTANTITTDYIGIDKYETEASYYYKATSTITLTANTKSGFYTRVEVYFKTSTGSDVLVGTSSALEAVSFASIIQSGQSKKGVNVSNADGVDDSLTLTPSFAVVISK